MTLLFHDLQCAFQFVSSDQPSIHEAYLCKVTGNIYYTSELGDSDELPEDIDDSEKYITIPHKNELDLGKVLVFDFISKHLPEETERIQAFFRRSGAYARYKDFLSEKGLLDTWYAFEDQHETEALKEWCRDNSIEVNEQD